MPRATGAILKGIREAGIDVHVATTDGNMTFAQLTQYAPSCPSSSSFPQPNGDARERSERDPAVWRAPAAPSTAAFKGGRCHAHVARHGMGYGADNQRCTCASSGPAATAAQLRSTCRHSQGLCRVDGIYDFEARAQTRSRRQRCRGDELGTRPMKNGGRQPARRSAVGQVGCPRGCATCANPPTPQPPPVKGEGDSRQPFPVKAERK